MRRRPRKMRRISRNKIRIAVMPDRIFVKLKYSESFNLAATTFVDTLFRGNSVFDPRFAVGGQSATGFAQWTGFYFRFCVLASSIRAQFFNDAGPPSHPRLTTYPTRSATALVATNNPEELSYARYRDGHHADSSRSTFRVKNYMTTKKIIPNANVLSNIEFHGTSSANATQEWYWHVALQELDGVNNLSGWLNVYITYYVVFYDRLTLAA